MTNEETWREMHKTAEQLRLLALKEKQDTSGWAQAALARLGWGLAAEGTARGLT